MMSLRPPTATGDPRPRTALELIAITLLMALLVGVLPGAVPGVGARAAEVGTGPSAFAAPRQEELAPGDCVVEVDKHASPDPVVQGTPLELTLSVRAVCEPNPPGLHLVLVVDGSIAAADPVGREIKDGLAEVLQWFDPSAEDGRLVGVVSFDDTARSVCELTADSAQLLLCIEALGSGGSGVPEAGLTEAMAQLMRGREQATERANLREIVLLVQAGPPANECAPVLAAASSLKGQGVLVIGVCAGPDCDASCTRQSATSGRYFFVTEDDWSMLESLMVRMREDTVVPRPLGLTVTETLSANMEYRPGSAVPAPDTADNGLLVWSEMMNTEGFTITFQVTPTELGSWPTGEEARARLTPYGRPPISVVFPNPAVNVIAGNWQLFMPALPQHQ